MQYDAEWPHNHLKRLVGIDYVFLDPVRREKIAIPIYNLLNIVPKDKLSIAKHCCLSIDKFLGNRSLVLIVPARWRICSRTVPAETLTLESLPTTKNAQISDFVKCFDAVDRPVWRVDT